MLPTPPHRSISMDGDSPKPSTGLPGNGPAGRCDHRRREVLSQLALLLPVHADRHVRHRFIICWMRGSIVLGLKLTLLNRLPVAIARIENRSLPGEHTPFLVKRDCLEAAQVRAIRSCFRSEGHLGLEQRLVRWSPHRNNRYPASQETRRSSGSSYRGPQQRRSSIC
jgi:hypothetical protein